MFSGWVYDALRPRAQRIEVAHPLMLKAIACAEKKNGRLDADKICDLLRCDLLPRCYMAPSEIRELRRVLRYRNLLVRQAVRRKNKIAALLMELGAPYDAERLHRKKYFYPLVEQSSDIPASVRELLWISREQMEVLTRCERRLLAALEKHELLRARVARWPTIPGVGAVLALTWALEVGEPSRCDSIGKAVSYCGLCAAQRQSAGKEQRGPLSQQRNKHLQSMLVEAAKLAPRYNEALRRLHERELQRGPRKLVTYLLATDRRQRGFEGRERAA